MTTAENNTKDQVAKNGSAESTASNQEEGVNRTNEMFQDCKGKYGGALVLGFNPEGGFVMSSSIPTVATLHWLTNRAVFELNVYENKHRAEQLEKERKAQESSQEQNTGPASSNNGTSNVTFGG